MENQEALVKRAKQLDLREALLNEKERRLDEKQATAQIEVLNKQIEAKEQVVSDYEDAILLLDKKLQDKKQSYKESFAEQDALIDKKEAALVALDLKYGELTKKNSALREDNRKIKEEIAEGKKYLREQEAIVDNTVADWNARLVDMQKEADGIEHQKEVHLRDIVRLEQDKTVIAKEVDALQDKLSQLDYAYEDKAAAFRKQLRELENEIAAKQKAQADIDTLNAIREKNLSTREKSVRVKEVVLKQQEATLGMKERKLKSDYGMAGEEWD